MKHVSIAVAAVLLVVVVLVVVNLELLLRLWCFHVTQKLKYQGDQVDVLIHFKLPDSLTTPVSIEVSDCFLFTLLAVVEGEVRIEASDCLLFILFAAVEGNVSTEASDCFLFKLFAAVEGKVIIEASDCFRLFGAVKADKKTFCLY